MNGDFDCPYCKEPIEVCHDDGFGCNDGERYQMECPHCEKYLVFTTSISIDHEPAKADCLNGSDHHYSETKTWPRQFSRLRCEDCDHETALPPERMEILLEEERQILAKRAPPSGQGKTEPE